MDYAYDLRTNKTVLFIHYQIIVYPRQGTWLGWAAVVAVLSTTSSHHGKKIPIIINRPGVAGAVLQTALSLID